MSAAQQRVAVQAVGECMVEVTRTAAGARIGYSGDTYNTAVYLARVATQLEAPVDVSYLTGIGDNAESALMRAAWAAEGIGDQAIELRGTSPGLYLITTDSSGEREFSYWRHHSAAAQLFARSDWIDHLKGDLIYLSGITLQLASARSLGALVARLAELRAEGTRVVFDSNYRAQGWASPDAARAAIEAALSVTDVALITWADEQLLADDENLAACAQRILAHGVEELVIKDGPNGAWVQTPDGLRQVGVEAVAPVDTTAAGDSFNGAYLAARLAGRTALDAANVGNLVARTVVRYPGAIIDGLQMPRLPA